MSFANIILFLFLKGIYNNVKAHKNSIISGANICVKKNNNKRFHGNLSKQKIENRNRIKRRKSMKQNICVK